MKAWPKKHWNLKENDKKSFKIWDTKTEKTWENKFYLVSLFLPHLRPITYIISLSYIWISLYLYIFRVSKKSFPLDYHLFYSTRFYSLAPPYENNFLPPSIFYTSLMNNNFFNLGGWHFEGWRSGDLLWPRRVVWRPSIKRR